MPSFEGNSKIDTWVYRVAINTAISFLRKKKTRRGYRSKYRKEREAETKNEDRLHHRSGDKQVNQLYKAISTLNTSEKAIITMYLEDFSYSEIAFVTDISENYVGMKLHRIKKKLSKIIETKMELDELKHIWQQQEGDEPMEDPRSKIKAQIDDKMHALEKEIRSRDRLEIAAAVAVMIIFGVFFYYSQSVWDRIGSGIVVLSAIYICYKLKTAQFKRADTNNTFDHPMEEHLKMELQQVKRQKKLLQNVAWWYIAPMTVGLILLTFDTGTGFWFRIGYPVLLLAFGGLVWKLNQRAVRKKFEPLQREIQEAIEFLEKN